MPTIVRQLASDRGIPEVDPEVAAIHACVAALSDLDPASVERVLDYIEARFKAGFKFQE